MATYGQYHVVEKIAVGGMAEIYRGVSRGVGGFESPVAIKKVLSRLSTDKRFADMLVREAKITARLDHEHIVKILDLGQNDEGEYFIVMEYVDGRNLRDIIDRAQRKKYTLTLDTILYVLPPICDAVGYAHGLKDGNGNPMNLIHRDISPSNILLSHTGEVKLTDFGVARFGEEASVVGSLKGKLAYMSPEQARGETLDHRSDVFSLGAILFELVLGRRLFGGRNDTDTLESVRRAEIPRPSAIDPIISVRMEQILLRALAPKPSARYQSADALAQELRSYRMDSCSARMGAPELSSWLARLFTGEVDGKDAASEVDFTLNTVAAFHEVTPGSGLAQNALADRSAFGGSAGTGKPQDNAAASHRDSGDPDDPNYDDDDDWGNSTIPGEPAEELLRRSAPHGTQKFGSPMTEAETASTSAVRPPINQTQPLRSPEVVTKSTVTAHARGTRPYERAPLPSEEVTDPTNKLEAITSLPSDALELDEETAVTDIGDLPFDLSELRRDGAKPKKPAPFGSSAVTAVLDEDALKPPPRSRIPTMGARAHRQRTDGKPDEAGAGSLGPVLGRRLAANEPTPDTAFDDEPTDGALTALSPEPVTEIGDPDDGFGLDDEGPTSLQPRIDAFPPNSTGHPQQPLGSIEVEARRRTWLGQEAVVVPPGGHGQAEGLGREAHKTLAPVAISDEIEFVRALGEKRQSEPTPAHGLGPDGYLPSVRGDEVGGQQELAPTPVYDRPYDSPNSYNSPPQPPQPSVRPELEVVEYHNGDPEPPVWPTKPSLRDDDSVAYLVPHDGGSSRFRRILPWLLVGLLGPPLGGVIGWLGIHFLSDANTVVPTVQGVDQGLATAQELGTDSTALAQQTPTQSDATVALAVDVRKAERLALRPPDAAQKRPEKVVARAATDKTEKVEKSKPVASATPKRRKRVTQADIEANERRKEERRQRALERKRKKEEAAAARAAARAVARAAARKSAAKRKAEKAATAVPKRQVAVESAAKGKLIIKSDPWAKVFINGRDTKRTTSATPFSVKAGKITVELVNPALNLRKKITLQVAAGQTVKKFVSLK